MAGATVSAGRRARHSRDRSRLRYRDERVVPLYADRGRPVRKCA